MDQQSLDHLTLTPVVKGEIIDAYLYDKGTNYGSTILNHQVKPDVNILKW